MSAHGTTARQLPGFTFLLAGMLLELMAAPFLGHSEAGLRIATLVTAVVLVAALRVVGVRSGAVALFIPALIVQLMASRSSASAIIVASAALRLVFLCYVVATIIWRVLHDRRVTLDTVAGAACAYVLLGYLWASLYVLLEYWRPGSFAMPDGFAVGPHRDLRAAFTYFSYGALTTAAFGDVHPTNPAAGGLAVAEALVGQLYLAIMIARMVGLHTTERTT